MFGHRAGSFTGALKDKKGLFEEANNGTIFLDEIGEMAFELQAKLLRILETGEYIKIGDTKPTQSECAYHCCHQPQFAGRNQGGTFP